MNDTCYTIEVRCDCQTDYECSDSWCVCVAGSLETAKEYVLGITTDDYVGRSSGDIHTISDEVIYDDLDYDAGFYRSIRYKDDYDEWVSRIYIIKRGYLP